MCAAQASCISLGEGATFFLRNEPQPRTHVSTAWKVAANMKSKQALVLLSVDANGWQC